MSQQEYSLSSESRYIRTEDFSSLDEETLLKVVREWLKANFDDPGVRCPHEGGEYIYIYGNPLVGEEIICEEFENIISSYLLKKLLVNIPEKNEYLVPIPNYKWSDYTSNDPFLIFEEHIDDIKRLSVVSNRNNILHNKYLGLLLVNTITAFETFIVDTLLDNLYDNEECISRCINSSLFSDDEKEKYKLNYEKYWKDIVRKVNYTSFHSQNNIQIFSEILEIEVGIDANKLKLYIKYRNDIVHRNGKPKRIPLQETELSQIITLETLNQCIFFIETTVENINTEIYDSENLDIEESVTIQTPNIRI